MYYIGVLVDKMNFALVWITLLFMLYVTNKKSTNHVFNFDLKSTYWLKTNIYIRTPS